MYLSQLDHISKPRSALQALKYLQVSLGLVFFFLFIFLDSFGIHTVIQLLYIKPAGTTPHQILMSQEITVSICIYQIGLRKIRGGGWVGRETSMTLTIRSDLMNVRSKRRHKRTDDPPTLLRASSSRRCKLIRGNHNL